jgi:hypothetical protein
MVKSTLQPIHCFPEFKAINCSIREDNAGNSVFAFAPVFQQVEKASLNLVQCGFDSHQEHFLVTQNAVPMMCET